MHSVTTGQFLAFFFSAAGRITRAEYILSVAFLSAAAFTAILFIATRMDSQPELSLGCF